MNKLFLAALSFILIGYAFGGRSFAYIGAYNIYVGEIVLLIAIITILSNRDRLFFQKHSTGVWLIFFMMWGAIRTFPYISQYGFDALRDGASWGYGIFAFGVGVAASQNYIFTKLLNWYRKWIVFFVLWVPLTIFLSLTFSSVLPQLPWGPGGEIAIFTLKGGDIAVHLAGILAFITIFDVSDKNKIKGIFIVSAWFVSFFLVGFVGRAAILTIGIVFLFILVFSSPHRWFKYLLMGYLFVSVSIIFDLRIKLSSEREISYEQLAVNVKSIFSRVEGFSGEGSKEWRLLWWSNIIDYAFWGEYKWKGKGYGINLADDDGFQVYSDHSLRSPHNGHLTFLARGGLPGLIFWVGLQISFFLSVFSLYLKWRRLGYIAESKVCLWIIAYWLAFLVNGAFDVFFEGPQGGIWFWSVFGIGMSMVYVDRMIVYPENKHA